MFPHCQPLVSLFFFFLSSSSSSLSLKLICMSPHHQPLVLFLFWLNWISLCPIASHAESHIVYKHDEVDMPQKYIQVAEELSGLPFQCFSGSPLLPTQTICLHLIWCEQHVVWQKIAPFLTIISSNHL